MGGNNFDAATYTAATADGGAASGAITGGIGAFIGGGNGPLPVDTIEQMIKDVGADKAPRITPEHIQDQIVAEYYATGEQLFNGAPILDALKLLTICVLVLRNGFTIVSKSACVSPENFNAAIGRRIAYEDAVRQIGQFEGYVLATKMSEVDRTPRDPAVPDMDGHGPRPFNS